MARKASSGGKAGVTPKKAGATLSKAGAASKKGRTKAADAYHHGNLREALIARARQALESASPETISLKSLALKLGVSQPAPYRHFADRDALMTAVAADGFARFSQALSDARAAGKPKDAFLNACRAYLEFGRANRGVYRLMFASNLTARTKDKGLRGASDAAFQMLLQSTGDVVSKERVYPTAMWIWSTLHGLLMLEAEGLGSGPEMQASAAEQVVSQMNATLMQNG